MKYLFLFLLLSFSASTAMAQSEIQDTSTYWMYAQLVGMRKPLSTKFIVDVDYGQKKSFLDLNRYIVDPETGKAISFNSMVDAMNFMGSNDWEFVQAFIVPDGNTISYHWVLKRACTKDEKGDFIPMTRREYKKAKAAKN